MNLLESVEKAFRDCRFAHSIKEGKQYQWSLARGSVIRARDFSCDDPILDNHLSLALWHINGLLKSETKSCYFERMAMSNLKQALGHARNDAQVLKGRAYEVFHSLSG